MRIQLDWDYPTPNNRQRAIAGARIEARIDASLPWTEINTVMLPQRQLTIDDAAAGDWQFRLFVLDVAGVESDPVGATASVGFDPPSPATLFNATVIT